MPDDVETTEEVAIEEVDGYAAGAVACAVASFVVPIVLAVAALILARASEVRRDQQRGEDDLIDHSRNDTLVWFARLLAGANIVLVGGFLIFLLLGIAARVLA